MINTTLLGPIGDGRVSRKVYLYNIVGAMKDASEGGILNNSEGGAI